MVSLESRALDNHISICLLRSVMMIPVADFRGAILVTFGWNKNMQQVDASSEIIIKELPGDLWNFAY